MTTDIDTNQLYGRYEDKENWQNKLHKKTIHKALNIPMDDDVNVTNTSSSGFGWKELAVLAALGLGGAAIYKTGGPQLIQNTMPNAPANQQVSPADQQQKFDVYFYDKDGNQITVPRAAVK